MATQQNLAVDAGAKTRGRMLSLSCMLLALPLLAIAEGAALQTPDAKAAAPQEIPVIDGSIGPCSVEFTVNGPGGKPVFDAKIRVHIVYGFMGVRKLDLEAGTNGDGKARFTGLPNHLKEALYFQAAKDNLQGSASYDPRGECKAKQSMSLGQAP